MSADPRSTKAERREQAREAADRLKAEQAASARRSRTIAIAALAAGLVVLVGLVIWIFSQSGGGIDPDAAPAGATSSGGIPVGQDGVAGTTGGSAVDATDVAVYLDFMCPYCAVFEEIAGPELDELRATGDVIVTYHPVSIMDRASSGTEYSTRAATAAALVADQAPAQFVDFLTIMFAAIPEGGTTGLADAQIADLARQVGVSEPVAATIADGSYFTGPESLVGWVRAATEQAGRDLDRLATPTILINGEVLDTEQFNWTVPGAMTQAVAAARAG